MITSLILVLFLGFSQALIAAPEHQASLKALASSINSLQQEVASGKKQQVRLQKSLQQSAKSIAAVDLQLRRAQKKLDKQQQALTALQQSHQQLQLKKQQSLQQLQVVLRHLHRLGNHSELKVFLREQNVANWRRLLYYHRHLFLAHQGKIDAYTQTLSQLRASQTQLQTANEQLEKEKDNYHRRQRELTQASLRRSQTLAKLDRLLDKKGQQLVKLQRDRQGLQQLLDKAREVALTSRQAKVRTAFHKMRGRLPLPTNGKIIHQYGRPQFGGKLSWQGVFIAQRVGESVRGVHAGRVIFADYLRGHGLLLIIDHGDDYMSLYGHNQTLLKSVGETVDSGEEIATVGSSAGQSHTGLYFEIRHKGQPQNPGRWLRTK